MTATNHVLTGALIGLTIHQPVIAIVVALISHFVLDAVPHYGDEDHVHRHFKIVLICDMLLASGCLVVLFVLQPVNWQLAIVCGITAASPDLMWLPMWLNELRRLPRKPYGFIKTFHKNIQLFERPTGAYVELVWAVAAVCALAKIT